MQCCDAQIDAVVTGLIAEIERVRHDVHELKRTRSEAEAAARVEGYRDGAKDARQQFYIAIGAPEIERLRAENADLRHDMDRAVANHSADLN